MVIEEIDGGIKISNIEKFSLKETFECGQCFRWERVEDKYFGIVENRAVWVYFVGDSLVIEGANIEDANSIWARYFDLDRNYFEIRKDLSKIDPVIYEACNFCPGIRILHQDPWETLCSFIISQNNNIPRIKGIIFRLCETFGDNIDKGIFSFPKADKLSKLTENELSVIRSGFRSRYILDAAKKVACGDIDLESISSMSIDEARKVLMKIKGVGPKVAECTLLYGFHRLEAFPIDVWMERVMDNFFPGKSPKIFGKYAGIAQQYLFHYTRTQNNNFHEKA